MTIKKNCFKFMLILILLNCQGLYAQISLCNLNTTENANNICVSSNYLVYISESGCETSGGTNCWCILVDNRNREYDGQQVEIKMDHSFRITWTRAKRIDSDSKSLELKFTITPGINRIYFEPYTSLSPNSNLISFKIDNQEICKPLNRRKRQFEQGTQDNYRYLNDCMKRLGYTASSERFCHNDDSDFVIEKRILTQGERYWCIIINNEKNVFSSANVLSISYSSPNKFVAWIPSDAYLEQNNGDSFTLGSQQTVVAVSQYNGVLSDLAAATIDDQSICDYFQQTATSSPRFTTTQYKRPVNIARDRYPIIWNDIINIDQPNQQVRPTKNSYSNLNDCRQRGSYTADSKRFCPNDGSDFVIEKRILTQGERYWCILINNEKNVLSSANELKISYSTPNYKLAWGPSDAKQISDDSFTLGGRQTVIAVSVNTGELSDLTTVTIDGQSICNYFNPPAETTPSPPRSTTMPYKPLVSNGIVLPPQYKEKLVEPQNKPSLNTNCGVKPPTRGLTLITSGLSTNSGDWPWHAAIYKLQSKINRNYICGGSLIDRKTIITAAHCIVDMNLIVIPDRLIVELGRYDLSIATLGTQEIKVFEVKPHESYNPETFENDIGILILANYVQVTTYVNFICLPEPNMNLQQQIGTTVGWGRDQNNQPQTKLKEASLPVIDNIMCLSSNREFFGQFITKTNFCAGYRNKTNVCVGDSGGGLVFEQDNHLILGGITSLGVSSKSTELPCDITQYALFTDVTKYVNWIKENS